MVGRVFDVSVDRSSPLPLPATHFRILAWVAGRGERGGTVGNKNSTIPNSFHPQGQS